MRPGAARLALGQQKGRAVVRRCDLGAVILLPASVGVLGRTRARAAAETAALQRLALRLVRVLVLSHKGWVSH